jgi:hypothetical protein
MSNVYHPDLLAPYLALPQGDKIQAECELFLASSVLILIVFHPRRLDRRQQ